MIKFARIFPLLCIVLVIACNNEIDLIEEGIDIPLVYGFVDLGDTAQYIRVERAFGSEDESAFELAKIKDSVFYKNIVVSIVNETTGKTHVLREVDGNQEGYQRDAGDFLTDPNILYKINTDELDFTGGEVATFLLDRGDDLEVVTATTMVIDSIELAAPTTDRSVIIGYRTARFNFFSSDVVSLIGLQMIIRILETDASDPSLTEEVEVVWNVADEFLPESGKGRNFSQLKVDGIGMYSAIAAQLDPDKQVERKVLGFSLVAYGAAEEVLEFRKIATANRGLTGAQELPNYSNLSEGLGIFSSKYKANYNGFSFGGITLDSIANGRITKDYGFIF